MISNILRSYWKMKDACQKDKSTQEQVEDYSQIFQHIRIVPLLRGGMLMYVRILSA
jgi:hypothetical protein